MSLQPRPLVFAPLSARATQEFADVRAFVAELARNLVGADLSHSKQDFPVLQAIVDHESMTHANYGAWVALGIAFGDALVDFVPGLAWRLVTDKDGTVAGLQYGKKTISIFATTMLWKRVERGEAMQLAHMAGEVKAFIEEHASEYGDA